MKIRLLISILLISSFACAQDITSAADSLHIPIQEDLKSPHTTPQEVKDILEMQQEAKSHKRLGATIAPIAVSATFITVGAIGVSNNWMCNVKQNVRDGLQNWRGEGNFFRADDYLQYFPLVVNVGLGFTGIKSKHDWRERLAVSATATVFHVAMTQGLKYIVNEERPNARNNRSFPSGHTSWAFMGAELIREEYGWAWGSGAYLFAAGIGFCRLYNNEHWLNDVVAGAGFGILSARLAYLLLPVERRLFRWDTSSVTTTCIPLYIPDTRTLAFNVNLSF